jgi:dTDP-4-dehydrorhamnose reductase
MSKILLIGASGLLGGYLYPYLKSKKKQKIQKFIRKKRQNLSNEKFCDNFYKNNKYDIIIFLSAITNIDECEKNKAKAYIVNYLFLKNTVKYSLRYNKKTYFIFLSTDQFYDQYKNNNINKAKIFNYYAKTKLLGEKLLENKNSCIIRTNFFGKSKNKNSQSFTDFIYKSILKKKEIFLYYNWYFSPIYIKNLCKIIYLISTIKLKGKFNIGSKKGLSKYRFGLHFANKLKLNTNFISKISFDDMKLKAKRPQDMRMRVGLINKKLNFKLRTLKDEINMAINDYK